VIKHCIEAFFGKKPKDLSLFPQKPKTGRQKPVLWSKKPKTAGNFNFPVVARGD
jgi:hypothetical protein